jgi:triosephosphate isomerase
LSRARWLVGNWKQHLLREEARSLAAAVGSLTASATTPRCAVAPTFTCVADVVDTLALASSHVAVFAQDVAAQERGAFTGEVGPAMLRDVGATGAIVGHSERRTHYGESDALAAAKLRAALSGGLVGILCVGETRAERDAGVAHSTVIRQLRAALSAIEDLPLDRLVVAYEPVWAIGSGQPATPEEAQAMHAVVRGELRKMRGSEGSDRSVLYGGSVHPATAAALASLPDVDGFLVGGASLDPAAFAGIHGALRPP